MSRPVIAPQPGPQTDFLACGADVVLYGGAAGGGKSFGLLLDALRYANVPGWAGVLFRRRSKDLTGPGSIFEQAKALYRPLGARIRESKADLDVTWPSGAALAFRHVEGGNVLDYQGREFAWIGFDEATHFDLEWIRYLLTRNRTTCGTKPVMRLSCNPDPDHPLREWVEPYLTAEGTADRTQSGRVRYFQVDDKDQIAWGDTREDAAESAGCEPHEVKSFAFVPSSVDDNPALLTKDPNYKANLRAAGAVNMARLKDGNWHVRAELGGMLRRSRWGVVEAPLSPIVLRVRGWDRAATRPNDDNQDPDFTAGVLLEFDTQGRFYVTDLVVCREEPPEVDRLMRETARRDGPHVVQAVPLDPGNAGKESITHTARRVLTGDVGELATEREHGSKVVKATPLALALEEGSAAEGEDWQPRGFIVPGRWFAEPYREAKAGTGAAPTLGRLWWQQVGQFFSPKVHDDIPDALAKAYNRGTRKPRRTSPRKRARLLAGV